MNEQHTASRFPAPQAVYLHAKPLPKERAMNRLLRPPSFRGTTSAAMAAAGTVPRLPHFLRRRQPVSARVIHLLCAALSALPRRPM